MKSSSVCHYFILIVTVIAIVIVSVEDVYQSILTKEASFQDKKFKHVSGSCMDFMKRLLVRDVRYRLTSAEALKHPFITGATTAVPRPVLQDIGEISSSLPVTKRSQIANRYNTFHVTCYI